MPVRRPSLFIGSSSEGLKIAKTLQVLLDQTCEVVVWSQGIFGLSQGTLESLVAAVDEFDFAVLALTPDDLVSRRQEIGPAPRDNVLFELGLFMGGLGRERTFLVYDRTANLKLPSDLAGVTAATFEPHHSGNLQSALGAAATKIEGQIERFGRRDVKQLGALSKAVSEFDDASSQMQLLVRLLARSRKVELDIISAQFGPLIESVKLNQMRQDLKDLESTLRSTKNEREE
jgi:hypothetical protein